MIWAARRHKVESGSAKAHATLDKIIAMQAINIDDLRIAARRRLPRTLFEFIDGGTQDETTLHANREDFAKWRFRTHTLTNVSVRDQSITLFG